MFFTQSHHNCCTTIDTAAVCTECCEFIICVLAETVIFAFLINQHAGHLTALFGYTYVHSSALENHWMKVIFYFLNTSFNLSSVKQTATNFSAVFFAGLGVYHINYLSIEVSQPIVGFNLQLTVWHSMLLSLGLHSTPFENPLHIDWMVGCLYLNNKLIACTAGLVISWTLGIRHT